MKKVIGILILFTVITLLTVCPAMAYEVSGEDIVTYGECGENAHWKLDASGVLTISGTGATEEWTEYLKPSWMYSYKDNITKVVIEDGIERIGSYAFFSCDKIKTVEIADSVKVIGERAFGHCYLIEDLTIPDGVERIEDGAFEYSDSIKNLTIPKSVRYIGAEAFYSCDELTSLKISTDTVEIGGAAFSYCYKLKKVTFPKKASNITIGHSAFSGCVSLESISLPEGIKSIGDGAFRGCTSLSGNIKIPGSVEIIDTGAFSGCESIESVTISKGVPSIGYAAFSDCVNMKYAVISGTVTYIDAEAFSNCYRLVSVIMSEGTEAIYDDAFEECSDLKSITIPRSLKSIGNGAFYRCGRLVDVYYGGTQSQWEQINIDYNNGGITSSNIHCTDSPVESEPETDLKENANTDINVKPKRDPEYMPDDINKVTINGKGDAYGRVLMYDTDGNIAKNKRVSYTLGNGIYTDTRTDEYGYATVKIADVTESREYVVNLEGDGISNCYILVDVTVEPLHFESSLEAIVRSGAGVGLGFGVGGSIGSLSAEAKIAEIGVEGSKQVGFSFSQEHINGKDKVILSSSANTDAVVEAKAGLFANAGAGKSAGVEASLAKVSGSASYGWISTVGYEDNDFKLTDEEDILDAAKFLAVASVSSNLSNVVAKFLAEKLAAPVDYFENGTAASLGAGAKVGVVEFGETSVSLGGIEGESVWENTTKTYKDDSKEYLSSVNVDSGVSLLNVDVGYSGAGTSASLTNKSLFSGNLQLEAKEDSDGNLQHIALLGSKTDKNGFLIGVETTTQKNKLTFEGENAVGVVNLYEPLYDFTSGDKGYFSLKQLKKASDALLDNEFTGKYSELTSVTKGLEFDLSAELQLGVELGFELGWSGLYTYEYEKKNGIFENGSVFIQGDNKIDSLVKDKVLSVENIVKKAKEKIADYIAPYLSQVEGWMEDIGEGLEEAKETIVKNAKAAAKKTGETAKKWKVKIKTAVEDFGFARVLAVRNSYALFSTSSVATTVGNPYIIEVNDEEGNIVSDLTEQPILLEIEYTQEDLDKAGVTDVQGMSILRWDEEKGVYVNVGGIIDEEAMIVSTEITVPGQYILAVDNCEPAVVLFSQNHTGINPTVSAYVSDMSGIEDFSLKLYGEDVVNMENLDDYYDYTTGLLEYETGLDMSGEYYFTVYAKDTFGNETTQDYIVTVNDDFPIIYDVSELGEIITQGETVTASVFGEEITSVILNVVCRNAFGEVYQYNIDMVEEDGIYRGNLPKFSDGDVAEVRVIAYNTFGNKAESEAMLCVIKSEDSPTVSILSADDGDITVKCTNVDLNSKIYLALYDENNQFIKAYQKDASETVVFENVEDGYMIKAFAWDENCEPQSRNFIKTNK